MIITATIVHAILNGSVEFGVGIAGWAMAALAADVLIAVATSNTR